MRFRPCIDIHNGKVKQIVGGSLKEFETSSDVKENFVSEVDASYYAHMYMEKGLYGGHIILLNKCGQKEYEEDIAQARLALSEFKNGLQIGGGITCDNAEQMLDMGASHVIVTSYVFSDGRINYNNLKMLREAVGKEHIVLDLSCRMRNGKYYVVTDRWQKFTEQELTKELIYMLGEYCDEYLVHAVDVEGRSRGIEKDVASLLGKCKDVRSTYAGGISDYSDIDLLRELGKGNVDFTVGSALDIFGGNLEFERISKIK